MFRKIIFIFTAIIAVCSFSNGENPIKRDDRHVDTTGDCPLITTYTWQGNGGVIVAPKAFEGLPSVSGVLIVDSIPLGSTIEYAYFVSTGWQTILQNSFTIFNGVPLATVSPTFIDRDDFYLLSFYQWDVKSMITGNGTYPFSCFDLNYCYLVYLVLIYQNNLSPNIMISLNEGSESLQYSYSITGFFGFSPGNGVVRILTQAGGDEEGHEAIQFNGNYLAGPGDVFVSNIGNHADYHIFNLNNIQSENHLAISTGADQIGAHLMVLTGSPGAIPPLNVTITPTNPPIQIPAGGGIFSYSVSLLNSSLSGVHYQRWIKMTNPMANFTQMMNINYNCHIQPQDTIECNNKIQNIPASYPSGNYQYIANVGLYPNVIYSADTLYFEKLTGGFESEGDKFTIIESEAFQISSYPNPFNSSVALRCELADASQIELKIFDISGREVASIVNGQWSTGEHSVVWEAEGMPSGIYFAKLIVDSRWSMVQKLLLLK